MKTVVIPDVHNHVNSAQVVLDKEPADEYVILGDIFDDFGDDHKIVREVAVWLKETLARPNVTVLFGNHDMPYRFRNPHVFCPGYEKAKFDAINSVMTYEDWDKMRFYKYTQGWYLSHAGLCPEIFSHPVHGITPEVLDREIEKGLTHLIAGENARFCRMGMRMGIRSRGGLTWLDWNSEFNPIIGVNQIVGHTPHGCVRAKYIYSDSHLKDIKHCVHILFDQKPLEKYDSLNFCIDTAGDHYAVIEDGIVSIKEREDLES